MAPLRSHQPQSSTLTQVYFWLFFDFFSLLFLLVSAFLRSLGLLSRSCVIVSLLWLSVGAHEPHHVRFLVVCKALMPVSTLHVHGEAAKADVEGHPGLRKGRLRRVLHVVLRQLSLDRIEVLVDESPRKLERIQLPELHLLGLVDGQSKPFVVHHVLVNDLWLA